jgi:hypothetical protein
MTINTPLLSLREPQALTGEMKARVGQQAFPITLILVLVALCVGCSQARKPVEEVDWGQPKPSVARVKAPRESGPGRQKGEKSSESPGDNRHSERAPDSGVAGDPGGGGSSDNGNGSESPSDSDEGGVAHEGQSAGGEETGGASGGLPSTEPKRPTPALPGREPVKPLLSAADAADSARNLLKKAQQLLRSGDSASAGEAAMQAYDQVFPHAKTDAECKKLCGQLEVVINSAGRVRGRAEAVPTRFE